MFSCEHKADTSRLHSVHNRRPGKGCHGYRVQSIFWFSCPRKSAPTSLLFWVTFLRRARVSVRAAAVVLNSNLVVCVAESLIQLLPAHLHTVSKGVDPAARGMSGILLAVCLESWCRTKFASVELRSGIAYVRHCTFIRCPKELIPRPGNIVAMCSVRGMLQLSLQPCERRDGSEDPGCFGILVEWPLHSSWRFWRSAVDVVDHCFGDVEALIL
jgi:hypothetical protein